MTRTDTVVIGAGQAGLAMSRCLTDLDIDHVVLERGRVAERWRSQRWDSLRLLTPNWQSRLPGWSYRGPDRDGYMTRDEIVDYLAGYASSLPLPVEEGTAVLSVSRWGGAYRVVSDRGTWATSNVVIATGQCDVPRVPALARDIAPAVRQITPSEYRRPDDVAAGGVLVVGASATGIQLADELHASGRPVTLAVGRHTRVPRTYRGLDIMWWLEAIGALSETAADVHDLERSRHQPSLQLVGRADRRSIDLATLAGRGVIVTGRLAGADGTRVGLADDLAATTARADAKLRRLLDRIEGFIDRHELGGVLPAAETPAPVDLPKAPAELDLGASDIRTVLWATGYRRRYPWLDIPVLDARGEIVHDGGVTAEPGLYVLGLSFLRRRRSGYIDGVGDDARALAAHIAGRLGTARQLAV